jgi:hypothetical protein
MPKMCTRVGKGGSVEEGSFGQAQGSDFCLPPTFDGTSDSPASGSQMNFPFVSSCPFSTPIVYLPPF